MIKICLESSFVENDEGVRFGLETQEAFDLVSKAWVRAGWDAKYVYGFSWLGRPIIQLPEDMLRAQEIIYKVKPNKILETGVAHGGSLVFYASLLKMMGVKNCKVVGVDIEIRTHNREAIESHELANLIGLIEGSSTAPETFDSVRSQVAKGDRVMVFLDSNHSRDHVLDELRLYSTLVSKDSYIVATDGIMSWLGTTAPRTSTDWNWNNPKQAVSEFLRENSNFELAPPEFIFNESHLCSDPVTYWPDAWLKRVK